MREKLIELLDHATEKFRFDAWENTDKIADFLIANGVTIPVQCKDCLYYMETIGKDSGKPCGYGRCMVPCHWITGIVYDENFCYYGERKDNGM